MPDVDHHALGIEITNLKMKSFLQSQAQRIDGPEVSRVAMLLDGSNQAMHFVDGEYRRKCLLLGAAELLSTFQSRGSVTVEKNLMPL